MSEDNGQHPRMGLVQDEDRGPPIALLLAGEGRELDPMVVMNGLRRNHLDKVFLSHG